MFILYFALGFAREALVTSYFKAVAARRVWWASADTFILSMLDFLVIAKVILDRNPWLFLAYAVGEATGTLAVMKMTGKKK